MKNRFYLFTLILFIAAGFSAFALENLAPAETATPARPVTGSRTEGNAPAVTLATRSHILQPLDKVAFYIEEDPAPVRPNERKTLDLAVSAQGQLEVPVSRCCEQVLVINTKGKTIDQAEEEIRKLLLAEYYNKATVQLRLVDTTKRIGQVWLTGAVKANTFQLNPGKAYTLWEVLTAVGLQEFANKANVEVTRKDPATGKTKTIKVDVGAAEKNPDKDIEVQDGDRVKVKEKVFNLL